MMRCYCDICYPQHIEQALNRDLPPNVKAGIQQIRIPKALSRRYLPLDTHAPSE